MLASLVFQWFSVQVPGDGFDKRSGRAQGTFSREGFCRSPRGIFSNTVPGEFCRGFLVGFWGLFPWIKNSRRKKSTQKSTAKFKSEFGSFPFRMLTPGSLGSMAVWVSDLRDWAAWFSEPLIHSNSFAFYLASELWRDGASQESTP